MTYTMKVQMRTLFGMTHILTVPDMSSRLLEASIDGQRAAHNERGYNVEVTRLPAGAIITLHPTFRSFIKSFTK